MTEAQIRKGLEENIQQIPSSNFNYSVLSTVQLGKQKKESKLISSDEPFLIACFISGILLFALCILYKEIFSIVTASEWTTIFLSIFLLIFFPICIIGINFIKDKQLQ